MTPPSLDALLRDLVARASADVARRAGAALLDAARLALRDSDPAAIAVELAFEADVDARVERGEDVVDADAAEDHVADALGALAAGDGRLALAHARRAQDTAPANTALAALASGALALAASSGVGDVEARLALARARAAVEGVFGALGHPAPAAHVSVLLWALLAGAGRGPS